MSQERKKIVTYLKRFSVRELVTIVPKLFNLPWQDLKREIRKFNLKVIPAHVASVCEHILQFPKLKKSDLTEILYQLQLLDVGYHKRNVWKGAELLDKNEDLALDDLEQVRSAIVRAYRVHALNADVYLHRYDGIIWVMVMERIHRPKKGVNMGPAIFYALHAERPLTHFFFSPRSRNSNIISLFSRAMGFERYKELELFGEDVPNMFLLLEKSLTVHNFLVPNFEPVTVRKRSDGIIDFTLGSERRKYAEEIFPGWTKFSEYSVQASAKWRGLSVIPEMEEVEQPVKMTLTFRSEDPNLTVEECFREMVAHGSVVFPVPKYMTHMSVFGKNCLKTKPKQFSTRKGDDS